MSTNDSKPQASKLSRREFMGRTIGAAAVASCPGLTSLARCQDEGDQPPNALPTRTAPAATKSKVVQVIDERIVPVRVVQRSLVAAYLRDGLCQLTGQMMVGDAWRQFLSSDDIILIKFNQSAADRLGTSSAVAAELVKSLVDSGWSPDRIMVLEAPEGDQSRPKTRAPDMRWQGRVVEFGRSGSDVFLAALEEATAIINVPFLKTHHRTTMTCCLKNLSHGLIRHPAKFHAGGCDPAIGEIVASEPIRSKLKLNIVNGLRSVIDNGPEARDEDIVNSGILLIGSDPVACDSVGFSLLNEIRLRRELNPLLPSAEVPRQFVTAACLEVGRFDVEDIDVQVFPS